MRKFVLAAVATAALIAAVAPTAAHAASAPAVTDPISDWVPAPSAPFDRAAGVLCDFAVHAQPTVDEVRKRVLASYPDGSPKVEEYVGDLVVRVTNTENAMSYDANASGSAVISYGTDGSMTWYVLGPTLIGFRAGAGTLPRGLWNLNGVYKIAFSPTGFKTTTFLWGTTDNVCSHLV